MTDTVTPESLRALAANLGSVEMILIADGYEDRAARVQASAAALYAAADEIERLEEHLAAAELGLSIMQKAKP